jgi:hypothetical protein
LWAITFTRLWGFTTLKRAGSKLKRIRRLVGRRELKVLSRKVGREKAWAQAKYLVELKGGSKKIIP